MVCKYLIRMERTRWVKTGLVSSCLDMLEQNILYQKALDLNIFGIQNILGDKKFFDPKFLDSELFFCVNFSWHQNLVQLLNLEFGTPNPACYVLVSKDQHL